MKELLDRVVSDRLEIAIDGNLSEEEQRLVFKQGMEALDRRIQLEKLETDKEAQREKSADAKVDQSKNRAIKIIEIAAVPAVLFIADCAFKRYYMHQVCNFERDYTFTTTPGRGIAGLFRLK